MAEERAVTVDLGDGVTMVVLAEQSGPVLVEEDGGVIAKLSQVTAPIEKVGREMLEAAKRTAPSKATVELGFGLAIEEGKLVALFGKAKGEASIKVTLEWEKTAAPAAGAG